MEPFVSATPNVHPSAIVDETAAIDPSAVVEAGAVVGPRCRIGPRCRLRTRAILVQDTALGAGNDIHPGAVLGGDPQDHAFDPAEDPGTLEIGAGNVFREGVTISRGAGPAGPTRIGDHGLFMACAHVGHNSRIEDHVTLTNFAGLAGHVRIGHHSVLSAYATVHQFCEVGEYVMMQGHAAASMHVPPYVILSRELNTTRGVNRVGLARSGAFSREAVSELRELYRRVLGARRPMEAALAEAEAETPSQARSAPARRFLEFMSDARQRPAPYNRGVCTHRRIPPARSPSPPIPPIP